MPRDPKYVVSDKYRFVYCVVQKVACTSIKTSLAPLLGVDGEALIREDGTSDIHITLRESRHQIDQERLFRGLDGAYEDYFRFAFVRDPYDRLLSCYLQKATPGTRDRLRPLRYKDVVLYKGMPFREFVEAVYQIPDEAANSHYRSQHVALLNPEGELIPHYVGRFENLREDFAYVTRKLGVADCVAPLPHLTRSPVRSGDYYDHETRQLVAERFARDFDLFGYEP